MKCHGQGILPCKSDVSHQVGLNGQRLPRIPFMSMVPSCIGKKEVSHYESLS